jgi:uncharacterized membrane protein (DUF485 family)
LGSGKVRNEGILSQKNLTVRKDMVSTHSHNRPHSATQMEVLTMTDSVVTKIQNNPKYQALTRKRNSFGVFLTLLMLVVYYGYIALIAFNKPFLAQPVGAGVTTIGIPIGMGVIIFTIIITGIYVRRANNEYDALTAEILKDATQ